MKGKGRSKQEKEGEMNSKNGRERKRKGTTPQEASPTYLVERVSSVTRDRLSISPSISKSWVVY